MKLLTISFALFLTLCSHAAKGPIKFGDVSMAELEMTEYTPDTSAVAVILCEYGKYTDNNFTFSHTIRIKILKKEGLSWGNFHFGDQPKSSVKGYTFNLENGEIVKDKLNRESIFQKHITSGYSNLSVAMPNVKVGSVLDIAITYRGIPRYWYFQRRIPVQHSELIMEDPTYVTFRKNATGYVPFAESSHNRWVTKEAPAMKVEAYTNSMKNYITKFTFELQSINFPGFIKTFANTWESISNNMYRYDYFGNTLFGNAFLNDIAKNIKATTSNKFEQLKLAHQQVLQVKWNEKEDMYTTHSNLVAAYKDQTGNSTDINMILIALLRKLDFEAHPVIMSTRSNGYIPFFPSQSSLNYTICQTFIDGEEYLIDATEEYLPFSLLHPRCLNLRGYSVQAADKIPEVKITPKGKNKTNTQINLMITPELNIEGTQTQELVEYAAYDFRESYNSFANEDEFLEDSENSFPGLYIQSMELENLDDTYQNIKCTSQIQVKNALTSIGEQLFINPMLHFAKTKNPFKLDERLYPVDYAYPHSHTYYIQYQIPDGYTIEELPKPMRLALPNKSASVMYMANHMNNIVTIVYKLDINKATFYPEEYPGLKQLYSLIIDKHAEPLILKKI